MKRDPQLKLDMPKGSPAVFRQRALNDDSVFPFGKHKIEGTLMRNVPVGYFNWFMQQDWKVRWPAVVAYIEQKRKEGVFA